MAKEVDYIIVGGGIAGVCFAKQCIDHHKSFQIITDFKPSASHVAAGLFNPIVIKRFNPVWRFQHQMALLQKTFAAFEDILGGKYLHHAPVYRIFSNEQEIKTWQNKIESMESLQAYLNPNPIQINFDNIDAPFGYGEVCGTGWIDLSQVLKDFYDKFQGNIYDDSFEYEQLKLGHTVQYKHITAKQIVFAEGIKVKNNPYFGFIPVRPNKGETLIIKIDQPMPNVIFNSKNFLMPIGNNKFYVGSTYDRTWENPGPTDENRNKLIRQLQFYYKGHFDIIEHRAAFRPTTPNMRPIVGNHPHIKNMYLLNGLGTRGTFNAPDMSRELFDFIEKGKALDEQMDVARYYKLINPAQ